MLFTLWSCPWRSNMARRRAGRRRSPWPSTPTSAPGPAPCPTAPATRTSTRRVWADDGSVTFECALDPAHRAAVVERCAAANGLWWQLDIDFWSFRVRRYREVGVRRGCGMDSRTDLHPAGGAHRKLAAVVQLSNPGDYDDGDLEVDHALSILGPSILAPNDRGTLVVMPGWTRHRVTVLPVHQRLGPKLR